jgi:hypothetical protein
MVIPLGVIIIIGDSMEYVFSLPLKHVNLILKLQVPQGNILFLIWCWLGPNPPHQCLKG